MRLAESPLKKELGTGAVVAAFGLALAVVDGILGGGAVDFTGALALTDFMVDANVDDPFPVTGLGAATDGFLTGPSGFAALSVSSRVRFDPVLTTTTGLELPLSIVSLLSLCPFAILLFSTFNAVAAMSSARVAIIVYAFFRFRNSIVLWRPVAFSSVTESCISLMI